MELSFFTTFEIGWLNGWVPSFAMLLVQIIFMMLFPQGGQTGSRYVVVHSPGSPIRTSEFDGSGSSADRIHFCAV